MRRLACIAFVACSGQSSGPSGPAADFAGNYSVAVTNNGNSAASSVVFGETFGPLRFAGMVTVVGGIAVMLLSRRPQVLPKIA